jgi:tetratricopeptide (TPR) repeat protein
MRVPLLLLAVTALAGPADAAQNVFGMSEAQVCYESATIGPKPENIDTCTSAIKRSELTRTDLAATYSNRGILWAARGRLDAALEDQNRAIDLNPTARAYVNRANVHYRLQRYDAALADYGQAIELSSGSFATVFYNRALAYKAVGNRVAARTDLERAVTLAPENATYREILATLK